MGVLGHQSESKSRAAWVLPLAVAVCLGALFVARARSLDSYWMDETFTALVARDPASRIVEISRKDASPPTYYLMVHGWVRGLEMLGLEPGLAWMRGMNAPFLGLLFAAAWCEGRRRFGAATGAVGAVALAFGAQVVFIAGDARNYMVVTTATFACWLLLMRRFEDETAPSKRAAAEWAAFAALSSLAVWTHLMGGLFLFFLGIAWIVLARLKRNNRKGFVVGGLAAQSAAVLSFLPWIASVMSNVEHVQTSNVGWMTKPTVPNLVLTASYWMPIGRRDFVWPGDLTNALLGTLTWLVPIAAAIAAWRKSKPGEEAASQNDDRVLLVCGATGVATSVAYTFTQWCLARSGALVAAFEGLRYPVIALGPHLFGLAALAVWAQRRLRFDAKWAAVMLAPWLLCALIGNALTITHPRASQVPESSGAMQDALRGEFDTVYLLPSKLAPVYERFLPGLKVLPVEELAANPPASGKAIVVRVPCWEIYHEPADRLLWNAVARGKLSEQAKGIETPPTVLPWPNYMTVRLEGLRGEALERWKEEGAARAFAP